MKFQNYLNNLIKGVAGGLAGAGVAAGSFVAIEALMPKSANASTVMSSCWRMTSADGSAGLGDGISWKILGACRVSLRSDGTPMRIQVVKPGIDLWAKPYGPDGNTTGLKPYQNPTGVWVYGIWESDSKKSAIFATQTW